jgi:hypothetical protein
VRGPSPDDDQQLEGRSAGRDPGSSGDHLAGLKGSLDAKDGVFKVTYPRSDLHATAAGAKIASPMGLTCWVAFKAVADAVMCMGDTVLLEDQVDPVMSVALDNVAVDRYAAQFPA